jgi:hypothetical protein
MPVIDVTDFNATVADADEEGSDEGYRLVRIADPEGNVIGRSTV